MTPTNKQTASKPTRILLTDTRARTTVPVTVDFGEFGKGEFMVRPLLYTKAFVEDIARKLSTADDNDEEQVDALMSLVFPLVADWDIYAPKDQILKILTEKNKEMDLGEPMEDEESEQELYKVPVVQEAMKLFPFLGETNGIRAILEAMASIPFVTTRNSKTKS
jgi:hypothetical protein